MRPPCSLLTCISQAIYDSKGAHSVTKPILVKPIYKSQDLSNLRPIALQNSLAKLPSKILATRLTDALHRNGALLHANEGFLRHKSTGNAIGTILSAFEDAVQFNKPLFGASLDIAKAYDSIRWFTIKNGMDRINLPQEFQDYAMGKMVNSTMEIRTRYGLTAPFVIERGVPQGCPLAPLLFIIGMDLLHAGLHKNPLRSGADDSYRIESGLDSGASDPLLSVADKAYADDTILLSSSAPGLCNMMQWQ